MGEAKRRGSIEIRKAEGIAKHKQAEQDRDAARKAYEDSLTPEQKEKRKKARLLLTSIVGIAASSKIL